MLRRKRTRQPVPALLGPHRVEANASVVIEGVTPEQVWTFIRPAENAVLTNGDTVRAFTVPGTGPGVGEEQCFVTLVNGQEHIAKIKVVAEEPNRFAEAIATNSPVAQSSRWEVEPAEGGTRLTATSTMDLPAGLTAAQTAENHRISQAWHDTYVRRVKTLLESGVLPPSA